jgi:hypothetical protein
MLPKRIEQSSAALASFNQTKEGSHPIRGTARARRVARTQTPSGFEREIRVACTFRKGEFVARDHIGKTDLRL